MGHRVSFSIEGKSHPDHMPGATLAVICELCRDGAATTAVPPEAGIFIGKVELPDHLPDLRNALRGPASGEAPVNEPCVFYGVRGGRPNLSRLTRLPSQPTRYATVIVGNLEADDDGSYRGTLFTAFGDNPPGDYTIAPQEPGDPFAPTDEQALAERVAFWRDHALSVDCPPEAIVAHGATASEFQDPTRSQRVAGHVNGCLGLAARPPEER